MAPSSPSSSVLTREGPSKPNLDSSPANGIPRILQGQEVSTLRGTLAEPNASDSMDRPVDERTEMASPSQRQRSDMWSPVQRQESAFMDMLPGLRMQANPPPNELWRSSGNSSAVQPVQLSFTRNNWSVAPPSLSLDFLGSNMKLRGQTSDIPSTRYSGFYEYPMSPVPNSQQQQGTWMRPPPSFLQMSQVPSPVQAPHETAKPKDGNCKLFGISLTSDPVQKESALSLKTSLPARDQPSRAQSGSSRSCTKVHKQGVALGRSVDLSRFSSYEELTDELDQLFDFNGELKARNSDWLVVYTDDEDDMMLAGDDPWTEFCVMVRKIFIYTREEVQQMNPGTLNSKSEEASSIGESL